MFTAGIDVARTDDMLTIQWQLSKIAIPLDEITVITEDNTYAGDSVQAVRMSTPYGTTDRTLIKTKKQDYLLFTTNKTAILNKINV